MAAANALDGHNWMYPLEFALFDSETKENWTWFMYQLAKAIGTGPNIAICTYACKGLEVAVKKILPNCEKRKCLRHLMDNLAKRKIGPIYGNLWPAARAYRPEIFEHYLNKVLVADPEVGQWLNKHHNALWARSKFSTEIKCDFITNNLAKSWNGWIKDFKDLLVDILADAIMEKIAMMWAKRRKIGNRMQGKILPSIVHQLNTGTHGLGNMRVMMGAKDITKVIELLHGLDVMSHVVNLGDHKCTCREWQITGKSCPHVLAAIST
ncbi:uncharacterized protein LOC133927632 [Phragmites australis]|uniref:uncharacterized protein LOC133927632 n=1 Tax=Phragmites australis TaxID=29695 RepID=UPI002D77ACE1|nr:uncharacterized protein LOC133927632 [Phragmites australis]